ncbi:ADAMTS-like protein 5 isoform X1 [Cebus imitator]|uniref:ADAMTS-like protein 5 isoform X1 n=1 Tax=Cebus imitator TaxID=2715852 RepID=UPI00080A41B1|nr:ADAMTS-like protein 5 isoform X1 [Cebus imitator]XP_037589355.1 ADAMTS-like protein 5 isoform X1 [Cebus imitator]
MGKLRPERVEWLASGHTERPRLFQNLLLFLWALLNCALGLSAQGPGEWTLWVSWTRCSSSCGRGVSVRSRRCLRLPGEEPCWGDSHEYRLCQLPDCPPGAVPFRDLQCALYNGRPVLGTQKTYQWVPFYGAPSQCDLNCLAEGHAFYHSFGRVLDGTACSPGAHGVCVAGRCLSAGCDGLLGSGALEDRCGRCGGANDSCLFVQRVFRDAGAFAGYWNVTLIPEGARHIRVAHRSRNHLGILGCDVGGTWPAGGCPRLQMGRLRPEEGTPGSGRRDRLLRADCSLAALMGGDGRYVLNGDWAVSPPGTYEAAGTHVVYTHDPGPEETLRAAGPTSDDLLLQVLLQEPNPGIEFEFWLPRERYSPFQARAQALGWPLRQPQTREVEPQPPAAPTVSPAQTPPLAPDPCPPCPDTRGRAHRLLHYCASDFVTVDPEVPPDPQPLFWQRGRGDLRRAEPAASSAPTLPTAFQARVLGRHRQAQETRYEVRIQLIYKNRTPLRAHEYVWALGHCPCPLLAPHRDYLLAVQRLVSPDGTQDRLLLPHAGYARPWSPAEDSRVRLTALRCPV